MVDATSQLGMIFQTGGNLSGQNAAGITKAAAVIRQAFSQPQKT